MTTTNKDTLSSQNIQDAFDAAYPQSFRRDIVMANLIEHFLDMDSVVKEIKTVIHENIVDYLYQKDEITCLPTSEDKKSKLEVLDHAFSSALFLSIQDEIIEAFNQHAYDKYESLLEDCNYKKQSEAA